MPPNEHRPKHLNHLYILGFSLPKICLVLCNKMKLLRCLLFLKRARSVVKLLAAGMGTNAIANVAGEKEARPNELTFQSSRSSRSKQDSVRKGAWAAGPIN